ncbi:MAG: SpoIIE family protein phosphatase [Bacteroidota bacterium]
MHPRVIAQLPDILNPEILLDSLAEGVIVADARGRFVFFNKAAEEILGIGIRQVSPSEWTAAYGCYDPVEMTPFPPADLALAKALQGIEVRNQVLVIRNPARSEGVSIRVSGKPILRGDGSLAGAAVVFQDITAERKAEASSRLLANAVEQTADQVVITDRTGTIEYVNPAFEGTTGYSRSEAVGQTPKFLRSGHHGPAFYEHLWATILDGKPYRGTLLNRKKNGETYWGEQTITPMKDTRGRIVSFVSVIKDITDQKKRQEQDLQLQIAHTLQERFHRLEPSISQVDAAGITRAALRTTGDYYDFLDLGDGSLAIAVADVCGHGIGAALIMSAMRAYLRAFARTASDPGVLLTWLNQELHRDLGEQEPFVTAILACIDNRRGILHYASAGHVHAFVLAGDGQVRRVLDSTGIPLGIADGFSYAASAPIPLLPGDCLVFPTDGILEATGPDGTRFGTDRLVELIRSIRSASAREIVAGIEEAVRSFSGHRLREDDMTVVVYKVAGSSP